jgi:hypothetical protein
MSEPIHPLAGISAALGRLISGVQVRWEGSQPEPRQRIYFANHTSHLDFLVLWAALPRELRAHTRPVAAKDYWEKGTVRPYLAQRVFRAVLVEREGVARSGDGSGRHVAARDLIDRLVEAMGEGSLIIFPGRPSLRSKAGSITWRGAGQTWSCCRFTSTISTAFCRRARSCLCRSSAP